MKISSVKSALNSLRVLNKPVPPLRLVNEQRDHLYKIQFHNLKPEAVEDYQGLCKEFMLPIHEDPEIPMELMASWMTLYGDQDQAIHVWKYSDNKYTSHAQSKDLLKMHSNYSKFREQRAKMLVNRRNDLLYEFGFWPQMQPATRNKIYELRSYKLQPGTMVDWAGEWNQVFARKLRQHETPVGGFFTDIGDLNRIYHIWAYDDLAHRRNVRNEAWAVDTWREVVANTQKLCTTMTSDVLVPMDFSPTQ